MLPMSKAKHTRGVLFNEDALCAREYIVMRRGFVRDNDDGLNISVVVVVVAVAQLVIHTAPHHHYHHHHHPKTNSHEKRMCVCLYGSYADIL